MSKPQLPARVDPELYAYLRYLRDSILALQKIASPGADEKSGTDDDFFGGEVYRDIAPTSLASGNATASWTSVDVSGSVSDSATHVDIWAHIEIGTDNDRGAINFGTDGVSVTKYGPQTMEAQDNVDTDASTLTLRVPLTSSKTFYYQVTGTLNTDAAWQIILQGEYASF